MLVNGCDTWLLRNPCTSVLDSIGECTSETGGNDFDGRGEDQNAGQKSGEQVQEVVQSLGAGLVERDSGTGSGRRPARAQCAVLDCFVAAGKRQMVPEVIAAVPVGLVRRTTALKR